MSSLPSRLNSERAREERACTVARWGGACANQPASDKQVWPMRRMGAHTGCQFDCHTAVLFQQACASLLPVLVHRVALHASASTAWRVVGRQGLQLHVTAAPSYMIALQGMIDSTLHCYAPWYHFQAEMPLAASLIMHAESAAWSHSIHQTL